MFYIMFLFMACLILMLLCHHLCSLHVFCRGYAFYLLLFFGIFGVMFIKLFSMHVKFILNLFQTYSTQCNCFKRFSTRLALKTIFKFSSPFKLFLKCFQTVYNFINVEFHNRALIKVVKVCTVCF